MEKLIYKAGTAVATAALILGSVSPFALADSTVEISGNGADSTNTANVAVESTTVVSQNNSANIQNDVDVNANSGNNEANYNTGGDVSVDTGNADADVNVSNEANSNVAEVNGCCPGDITAKISGNGDNSDNEVNLASSSETYVEQNNEAKIKNDVDVNADTGNNEANYNTGGNVSIDTGNASSGVTINNKANQNVVQVGGGNGGLVWVEISGNGADSTNTANVAVEHLVAIAQNNWANIKNDVDVNANSGNNEANYNTNGDVEIDTGNADADVDISNLANFNAADVDACGCLLDLTVKIKNNGYNSDNEANVYLASALFVEQNNEFSCKKHHGYNTEEWGGRWHKSNCNDVDVNVDTGNNEANDNTDEGEPSIDTGNADADVSVSTEVNSNVVGDVDGIDLPDFDFPSNFSSLLVLLLALFS